MVYINNSGKNIQKAKEFTSLLIDKISAPEKLVEIDLPHNVPGSRLYDLLLKNQRRAEVVIDDFFKEYVTRYIATILDNNDLLESYNFKAIISSHTVSLYHSSLIWLAIQKGIPAYVMDNAGGSIRIRKFETVEDYFMPVDVPGPELIKGIDKEARNLLAQKGKAVLEERFSTSKKDLSGRLAYPEDAKKMSRDELCKYYNWDPGKPIVSIMLPNWFDFPHTFGMHNFDNIADWLRETYAVAKEREDVNWLIKPHPASLRAKWSGGSTIESVLGEVLSDRIRLFSTEIHSLSIVNAVEGIITPLGTSGLEYSAMGKKVLLADKSFYSSWNFCYAPESRVDYIETLKKFPDNYTVTEKMKEDALIYFSLYLGTEKDLDPERLHPEDALSYDVYKTLPEFLKDNEEEFKREQAIMCDWLDTEYRSYHAYKVARSYGLLEIPGGKRFVAS